MRKSLIIVSVAAILAVALLSLKRVDSNSSYTVKPSDTPTVFPNKYTEPPSQQELSKQLARIEAMYSEQTQQIDVLHHQLASLTVDVNELQASLKDKSTARTEATQNHTNMTAKRPAVATRFDNNDGNSLSSAVNGIDIEEVVYANLPTGADAPMTDCRGSLCKVYTYSGDPKATNNDFVNNLSKNLDGNVNVYFAEEAGQQVIYVEAVE